MNSTLTGAVASYLAQVRAELSDLPPGELEDVLDDVSGHLTEVAAEFEAEPTAAALQERLGTPREYAAELRTAAGYPPRTQPVADRDAARKALRRGLLAATAGPFLVAVGIFSWSSDETLFFGLLGLGVLFAAAYLGVRALGDNDPRIVLETPRGRRAAEAIRGLVEQIPPNVRSELVTIGQPVWWVARGAIGGGGFFALFGAGAVAVVGALAGAAVSIWIGRRTQQDRRWLWYVVPLNVVAAIAVPAFLSAAYMGASFGFLNDYRGSGTTNYVPDGLFLNGTPVSNIYPFDAQGKQVTVRLYDQEGTPIALRPEDCEATYGRVDHDTASNIFPHRVITPDENGSYGEEGNCQDTDAAPFVPPPAPATPIPTPSAGRTPTPGTPTPTPPTSATTTPRPGVTLTVQPTR
ncbi:HAAS signaling domain-containing protein [Kribbella sp. CA-247076]|uniref:HAAS signaling domain-containing protein n=1 Tax=Kribbella sp. CA-247076 TaxID=3239941 RepID=UPI003D9246EC